jgi:hypothetical protein
MRIDQLDRMRGTNSGSTCTACDGTLNHSRRRWMVMAKKLSVV